MSLDPHRPVNWVWWQRPVIPAGGSEIQGLSHPHSELKSGRATRDPTSKMKKKRKVITLKKEFELNVN